MGEVEIGTNMLGFAPDRNAPAFAVPHRDLRSSQNSGNNHGRHAESTLNGVNGGPATTPRTQARWPLLEI